METWVLFQKVVSSEWWFYRECWFTWKLKGYCFRKWSPMSGDFTELNCFTWKLEEFCFRKWSPVSGDFTESVDLHGTLRSIASESGLQWVVTLQRVLIYMEPWGVLLQKVVSSEWWLYRECWFTWKLEEFCFRKWSPVSSDFTESWIALHGTLSSTASESGLRRVVSSRWSFVGGFLCQNDVCCMFKTVVLLHCLFPGPVYLLWLSLFYFGVCWFLTHFVLVNRTFMYDIVEIIIDSLWIYFP